MKLEIIKSCKWGDTGQIIEKSEDDLKLFFAGRVTPITDQQTEQLKNWNKDKQVPAGGTAEYYEKEKLEKLQAKVNEENEAVKNGFPLYFRIVEQKALEPEDIQNMAMTSEDLMNKKVKSTKKKKS